jgi:hypothetical protein
MSPSNTSTVRNPAPLSMSVKECVQLSIDIQICSQIVRIEHKKSFFQPSVSDSHSKACDGMKAHAFSTVNQETALSHRKCEAPASSTRPSARTHLPHVSLSPSLRWEGRGRAPISASRTLDIAGGSLTSLLASLIADFTIVSGTINRH